MRANLFPIFNNSFLVYKEALKNNKTILDQHKVIPFKHKELPEILFITSYSPRECGKATYTQDLKNAILEKFGHSFSLKGCALEANESKLNYPAEVKYILQTEEESNYKALMHQINSDKNIKMIFLNTIPKSV